MADNEPQVRHFWLQRKKLATLCMGWRCKNENRLPDSWWCEECEARHCAYLWEMSGT